jgi:CRP/FNR family cyclic AMP-dependent transcriptional regulator
MSPNEACSGTEPMEETRLTHDTTPLAREPETCSSPQADPVLPSLGILVGLGRQSLENLARFGQYHHVPAGTEIIREGALQDRFYVVISGELSVSATCAGREVPLSTAIAGECLGELSLLEPGPASANIRVIKDAALWTMDIEELRAYILEDTGDAGILLMGMASCLSSRLRKANILIGQHHIVPLELPPGCRERAITAADSPIQLGFFGRLKKAVGADQNKKIRISTKIKM